MVGSVSQNLTDYDNPFDGAFTSPADGFQKYRRGVSDSIPFALLDDSLTVFPEDTLGIVGEANDDEFFGVVDTENDVNSGAVSATWTFDVSATDEPLELSVDAGAMGDFETSDGFSWNYAFDGGASQVAFESAVDEAASQEYMLDGGASTTLPDPLTLQGSALTNDLAPFSAPLSGGGNVLEVTLTASFNGGDEAVAFQNLVVVVAGDAPAASTPFINELHYDNDGGDSDEAIEIAGPACTDLAGWSVALYNGASSQRSVYGTIDLGGTIPGAVGGYGVLSFARSGIQNGSPDGLALVDPGGAVVQFLSYEGTFEAASGPAAGLTSTDIGVSEPSDTPVGSSLQLTGSGSAYEDFAWSAPGPATFGAVNAGQTLPEGDGEVCDNEEPEPTLTFIHEIQGDGDVTPLLGQQVVIEGIVVGDFQDGIGEDGDLNGFFVQEEDADADGDPGTSEGIFVFEGSDPSVDVAPGDPVRVTGTVSEFESDDNRGTISFLTQISSPTVEFFESDASLPSAVTLGFPATDADLEALEGMRVVLPELVISEYFNFDRFGEIVLALSNPADQEREDPRQFQPTSFVEPGPAAVAEALENELLRITLDDGRSFSNPDPAIHPNGSVFDLENRFRGGDTVEGAMGVMSHTFGLYRVQPTYFLQPDEAATVSYSEENPRPAAPDAVGGDLTVASFNVLNYFTTLDTGDAICGPSGNLGCRGADNAEEFARQRAKIIAALAAIDADVVGLIEIENEAEGDVPAVADLVAGLNESLGAETYAYVRTGPIGTDAIKVAFIYKPARVVPVGDYAILDESVDPRFIDSKNRPALAQSFEQVGYEARFTAVVNHFKSKGSDCDDIGDPDTGDGQGNCNLTREAAAQALVDWLETDPTGSGDPDALILGDLNAYDEEDPIDALEVEGYTDLLEQFEGEFAYTYVFDGQFGYLDYGLANTALSDQVTGATAWHINADEPDILDYDTSFKREAQAELYEANPYRSSDHDPVIVGLFLDVDPVATIENLLAEIETLAADGVLNRGNARAMTGKLERALRSLERGNARAAAGQLGAFANQAEALGRSGRLPADVAAYLANQARRAAASL